jgi:anti-sigma factor RsiW
VNGHLGDQVAAFVDGELGFAARERALEHLSRCPDCRAAVAEQRRVKARVQTLPTTEPSAHLISNLTQVAELPGSCEPHDHSRGDLPGRLRRGGLLLAGAGSVAAGFIGVAYVVGGAPAQQYQPVSPPVGQFSAEFAGSRQPTPFSDPAMDVLPVLAGPSSGPTVTGPSGSGLTGNGP